MQGVSLPIPNLIFVSRLARNPSDHTFRLHPTKSQQSQASEEIKCIVVFCVGQSSNLARDVVEENDVRSAALNVRSDNTVELLAVLGAHVSLERILAIQCTDCQFFPFYSQLSSSTP